jgi:hypothetical protein
MALLNKARIEKVDGVIYTMLSHANVVLHDQSLNDLKVPKFKGASVAPNLPMTQCANIIWNFAILVFAPLALYLFFRQSRAPEIQERLGYQEFRPLFYFEALTYSLFFRIVVVLAGGAVILGPVANAFASEYDTANRENYLSLGILGIVVGLSAAFALYKIGATRSALSSRWLSLSILILFQIAVSLALDKG